MNSVTPQHCWYMYSVTPQHCWGPLSPRALWPQAHQCNVHCLAKLDKAFGDILQTLFQHQGSSIYVHSLLSCQSQCFFLSLHFESC